ncbi:hypothetical protein BGZ61DRAFT_442578 [Ilyonectria robusta]|uniref:uncharacterized protein n=1 Tax=Ilyonectria robusta TaxID=1079257 RepID=UPI001E8CD2A2|nr:uncharacterized protein BGZ61DRAFT_442578 [Ilyonectria robusta]KAH8734455.1 hypothetical protein BGZ61DRAFT_442578 [Ilyonectria robusta]
MACLTSTPQGLEALLQGLRLDPLPQYASNDALTKPVEIWRSYFAKFLSTVVDCDEAVIQEAISSTTETSLGDLALILPRLKLKDIDNNGLKTLAFEIGHRLPSSPLFLAPWVDGIHLRMFFSPDTLPRLLLPYISDRKSLYGHDLSQGLRDPTSPGQGKKKVVVEFSSPNVATDFDGNHLRSTLIGAFVANIYEAMGWEVERLNYLGDWGKQIGLLAVGYDRFSSEEELQSGGIHHLLDVYAKIQEIFRPEQDARDKAKHDKQNTADIEGKGIFAERDAFVKKLEDGDETALALWKRFRDITIDELKLGYGRLGVEFDEYWGESEVQPKTIAEVEGTLKEKGVLEESDGSWMIDFVKHAGKKGLGTQIVRGRDGSTRYLLRDIAGVLDRSRKFAFDKMIYVVSARQDNHFQQLFTSFDLMDRSDLKGKLQHVNFGAIHGVEGSLLSKILDQCAVRIHDALREEHGDSDIDSDGLGSVSDVSLISGLLALDMSGRRGHNYTFDPKKIASSSSHTGLVLQACHGVLNASIDRLTTDEVEAAEADYATLSDDDSADLLRLMAQFPNVVVATYKSLEPHTLLGYLYKVVSSLSMLGDEQDEEFEGDGEEGGPSDLGEKSLEEKKAKLVLYQNARQVLENGMKLLGFPVIS